MRRLSVFLSISLDGYFTDARGDMSWAHSDDPEFGAFIAGNASGGGQLLMGRVTYQMMEGYWPTAEAKRAAPVVADGMNRLPKLVFSRSLAAVSWSNTRLAPGDAVEDVRRLKSGEGADMVVLGSGSIAGQLAQAGLVDSYSFVVVPVALGAGRSMFDGLQGKLRLTLTETRAFRNGNVLLRYHS